jgi:hypothetical protein
MNQRGKLPSLSVVQPDLFPEGARVLGLHDCEPDDKTAIAFLHEFLPEKIPMFLLTVSPNPEHHTEEITKLLSLLRPENPEDTKQDIHSNYRELTIATGARYGSQIEGKFKEPEDQSYVTKLNDFIMGAPDNGVIVYLLTTCYSLMKHWKDEWKPKIRIVFNMGGEGLPLKDKDGKIKTDETGKAIMGLGFNYRVGTEFIDAFMSKIPVEKRIILETNIYNPEFKKKFNGIVSICPRTFGNFSAAIMEKYLESNSFVKSLVDANKIWIDKQLQGWEEGEQYYPDKRMKQFFFGPADILLAVCSLDPATYKLKEREITVGEKKYTIRSMVDLDYHAIDHILATFINGVGDELPNDQVGIDVSFKRPKREHQIHGLLNALFGQ